MTIEALQQLADEIKADWGLHSWTIAVQELPEDERIYGGRIVYGDCNPDGNSEFCPIRINTGVNDGLQRHTLYHEMTHLRLEGHRCKSFYERGIDVLSGFLCNR